MKQPLASLAFALATLTAACGVEIIAHRGASGDAPENTLASVRLAWEQKADAVEVDIHLSKDGQIVVLHDADTKRTTGVAAKVGELALEELRALDAGSWKGPAWRGERIPTLAEVLRLVPTGKRLFIEIKCGPEVLPVLERVLGEAGLDPVQTVLIGFDYETMVQARKRFPRLQSYWLAGFKQDEQTGAWSPEIETLIAQAKMARVAGLNLSHKGPLDTAAVGKIKEAGLGVYVWTVNDAALARRLVQDGVQGITTDLPGTLREQLKE